MENTNSKKPLTKEEKSRLGKIFWNSFLITILFLAGIFIGMEFLAYKKSVNSDSNEKVEKKLEQILNVFKNEDFSQKVEEYLNISDEELRFIVSDKINELYAPVYENIDNLSDFHYSVTGEYEELIGVLTDNIQNILQEHLFGFDFEDKRKRALYEIRDYLMDKLNENLQDMKEDVKNSYELNEKEIDAIFDLVDLSSSSIKNKLNHFYMMGLKGNSIGAGVFGAVSVGAISAVLAKKAASKILAKFTIKAGAKAAGSGGSALVGAEIGSFLGPIGSAVGGAVGAVVGWLITDKIVVEVDRYFNEDEFKEDIRSDIDSQKYQTIEAVFSFYKKTLSDFIEAQKEAVKTSQIDRARKIEEIKSKSIKDLIGN